MAFLTEVLFPGVPNQVGKLQKFQGVDEEGGGGGYDKHKDVHMRTQYNKKIYREIRLIFNFILQDFVRMQVGAVSRVLCIHFVWNGFKYYLPGRYASLQGHETGNISFLRDRKKSWLGSKK